jgi:hypothetical protein
MNAEYKQSKETAAMKVIRVRRKHVTINNDAVSAGKELGVQRQQLCHFPVYRSNDNIQDKRS